jgi:hypothetical protein
VIRPSADQPVPTLRAEVPANGQLKASYVLHTGPLLWEGTITVAHEAVHRASVAITRVRTLPRYEA